MPLYQCIIQYKLFFLLNLVSFMVGERHENWIFGQNFFIFIV